LNFGVWIWYSVENRIFFSDRFSRMLGLEKDVYPTFEILVECLFADDVMSFFDTIDKILHDSKLLWMEFRINLPDNTMLSIQCFVEAMRSESGDVMDIVGVCFEISE
jgi:hypothetical protein